MADSTKSHRNCLTRMTSYMNEDEKENKDGTSVENIQPSSQILQTNLVHDSSQFVQSNTLELNQAQIIEGPQVILGEDDQVMYISTEDGISEHLPLTLSSRSENSVCLDGGSTLNQNYLVVVENGSSPQAVPTEFNSSIVLSSETCNTNSSLASTCPDTNGLNPADSEPPQQQTIMVLDGAIQSDEILIDPNVLVAYDHSSGGQMTLTTEPILEGSVHSLSEFNEGSLIHLEQVPSIDETEGYLEEREVLQKPTSVQNIHSVYKSMSEENKDLALEDSSLSKVKDDEQINSKLKEDEQINSNLQKDLRLLVKSHLQYHIKEVKKKICNKGQPFVSPTHMKSERNQMPKETTSDKAENSLDLLTSDLDNETPVFSNVTAKINADFLALIPGCQRFLLEMEKNPLSSHIQMSFESDVDCTVSGSLKALADLHNCLKKLLRSGDVSLLDLKMPKLPKQTQERSVMCTLLQPFVSSRGRQPKYSYKAKALGFISDFEALLNVDNEGEADEKPVRFSSRIKKRKRGRPRKFVKSEIQSQEYVGSPKCIDSNFSQNLYKPRETGASSENRSSDNLTPDVKESFQISHANVQTGCSRKSKSSKTSIETTILEGTEEGDQHGSVREQQQENIAHKFFCHICPFKTHRQSNFLIHMRCHRDSSEKVYHCKKCDFVSLSLPYLKRHEIKHKENLFKCNICTTYQTDKKTLLYRHVRIKHSIRIEENGNLQCEECNFQARNEEELIQHKLGHNRLEDTRNKIVYSCPECKKTLRSKMHLHRHIRDVHGPDIRPYLCDKCGKAFKRTDALKQHKALHDSKANRILPHKCSTCGKAFRSLAHLKEHSVIHSSDRPYLCQYCGAAFKTQAVQKRHILTLHIKPRAHVCSVCCRQFNTKHALQRHENTHVKPEDAEESPVLVVGAPEEAPSSHDEKEKREAISNIEAQVARVTVVMKEEEDVRGHTSESVQDSNALVPDLIGTSSVQPSIEDHIGSDHERMQQAYLQGNQDSTTLYYFTGDLNSL